MTFKLGNSMFSSVLSIQSIFGNYKAIVFHFTINNDDYSLIWRIPFTAK